MLTPEQSLALDTFTDFNPLVNVYLDNFLFLVLFDPTDARVSDFASSITTPQRTFIQQMWINQQPQARNDLVKIIRFTATSTLNTAGEVIRVLRTGNTGTVTAVFNIFKVQIPLIISNIPV